MHHSLEWLKSAGKAVLHVVGRTVGGATLDGIRQQLEDFRAAQPWVREELAE